MATDSTGDDADADLGVEVTKGLAAKPLQSVLGFAGVVIFARELGPEGIGAFYLLMSIAQVIDFPVNGMSASVKKRYSEAGAPRAELFGVLVGGVGISVLLAAAGALVFADSLDAYVGLDGAALLFIGLFTGVIAFYPLQDLLVATGRLGFQTWTDTLRSIVTLGVQLPLVVLASLGVAGMVGGYLAGVVLVVPVVLYALGPSISIPSRDTIRDVWSFARYSSVSAAIGRAYDRYDVLLLGLLIGPAAAGDYEVALRLVVPGAFVSALLGSGLMAKVSTRHSRGADVAEPVTDSVAFASVLSIPLAFGAAALARPLLITAYGPAYADAAPLLVGLGVWQVFSTQTGVMEQALYGVDRPRQQTYAAAATLALNVILGVVLVVHLGALGVVVATVIAEGFRYVVLVSLISRVVPDVTILPRTLLTQVAAGGATYVAATLASQTVAIGSWATLLVVVGIGAVVYGTTLFVMSSRIRTTAIGVARRLAAEYV